MKISRDEIFYINEFDKVSGVGARDCIINKNNVMLLIDSEKIGKAIGKKGTTVKKFSSIINKKVVLLPYYDNIKKFLEEGLDIKANEVNLDNGSAVLKLDSMSKRRLINNMPKFKLIKQVVARNYGIKDIKVR